MAKNEDGIPLRDRDGEVVCVDARAAVRHDRVVLGGLLVTLEGGTHYTSELCAHIDAAVDAGGDWAARSGAPVRAAYVFDATSSVRVESRTRFRMSCIPDYFSMQPVRPDGMI